MINGLKFEDIDDNSLPGLNNSEDNQFLNHSANLKLLDQNSKKLSYKPSQNEALNMKKVNMAAKSYFNAFQKDIENQTISQVCVSIINY